MTKQFGFNEYYTHTHIHSHRSTNKIIKYEDEDIGVLYIRYIFSTIRFSPYVQDNSDSEFSHVKIVISF